MRNGTLAVATLLASTALVGCSTQSVFELEVGTCINADAVGTELDDVPTVECSGPHDLEVFDLFDLPADMEYSEDIVGELGFDGCVDTFEAYVGVDVFAPEAENLDIYTLTPTAESWEQGDVEVVCLVGSITPGEKLTGSARNSLG